MKNIYNDLVSTYYDMKNQKIKICNDINDLKAQIEQLEHDITRIEYILAEYGIHQSEGFIENKAESEK